VSHAFLRSRSRRVILGVSVIVIAGSVAVPVADEVSEASRSDASLVARSSASHLTPVRTRSTRSMQPCGPQRAAAAVAAVDAQVARRIYADELAGRETLTDQAHIRQSRALSSALSVGDPAAIYAAVHEIVYRPKWHIVRLRVLIAGRVIADVGGPYVIAPVSGVLRRHGRTIGSYVMSVQDDVGYVKLVSRFIGVPVDLYRGRSSLMGTLQPAPALPSSGATIAEAGTGYRVRVLEAGGFPAGSLKIALFAPQPPRSLSSQACPAVLADAWGSIAVHVASRFTPLSAHFNDLAGVVKAITGGSLYVLSGGRQLAGGKLPGRLPESGTMRIAGRTRGVFSWAPSPGVRVYLLTP
jgi:hypothetical protein